MVRFYVTLAASVLLVVVLASAAVIRSDTIPSALVELANAERAFAKMASDQSIRDAFIEYFADESVNFNPTPGPARQRLKDNPKAFPPGMKLLWEPRVGDVAASGDLGYLTGPTEMSVPGKPAGYGNYFSVWKKQADGKYRVILDIGANQPEKPVFADGFVRSAATATYKGKDTKAAAEASLLASRQGFRRRHCLERRCSRVPRDHARGRAAASIGLSVDDVGEGRRRVDDRTGQGDDQRARQE